MVRHRVHRLVVRERATRRCSACWASSTWSVSWPTTRTSSRCRSTTRRRCPSCRRRAAHRRDGQLLHDSGIRIERITRLVGELNRACSRACGRCWRRPSCVANSCLLVMGSEGRGEQILKTDQDNALLLRDGFECAGLAELAARFNAALVDFGYPPCPGDIMLTNPLWRQPLAAFRDDAARLWLLRRPIRTAPMHLAIFLDAAAVAGDAALLQEARAHLDRILVGRMPSWRASPPRSTSSRSRATGVHAPAGAAATSSRWTSRSSAPSRSCTACVRWRCSTACASSGTADAAARAGRSGAHRRRPGARPGHALHLLMGLRLRTSSASAPQGWLAGNEVQPSELSHPGARAAAGCPGHRQALSCSSCASTSGSTRCERPDRETSMTRSQTPADPAPAGTVRRGLVAAATSRCCALWAVEATVFGLPLLPVALFAPGRC